VTLTNSHITADLAANCLSPFVSSNGSGSGVRARVAEGGGANFYWKREGRRRPEWGKDWDVQRRIDGRGNRFGGRGGGARGLKFYVQICAFCMLSDEFTYCYIVTVRVTCIMHPPKMRELSPLTKMGDRSLVPATPTLRYLQSLSLQPWRRLVTNRRVNCAEIFTFWTFPE